MVAKRLKPWPSDAVMVVAPAAGEEIAAAQEGVYPALCRDCFRPLHADTFTVRRAMTLPQRGVRPVMFFCLPCHANYDRSTLDVLERHNTPGGRAEAAAKMVRGE